MEGMGRKGDKEIGKGDGEMGDGEKIKVESSDGSFLSLTLSGINPRSFQRRFFITTHNS